MTFRALVDPHRESHSLHKPSSACVSEYVLSSMNIPRRSTVCDGSITITKGDTKFWVRGFTV